MWYEADFISSFSVMIAHKNHVNRIKPIHCCLPMEKVEPHMCKTLNDNVTLLCLSHSQDHFAVMEGNLETKMGSI